MDQQEAMEILREYADVFAKDNLDLGQTSVVKHKLTLKRAPSHSKNAPGLYEEL